MLRPHGTQVAKQHTPQSPSCRVIEITTRPTIGARPTVGMIAHTDAWPRLKVGCLFSITPLSRLEGHIENNGSTDVERTQTHHRAEGTGTRSYHGLATHASGHTTFWGTVQYSTINPPPTESTRPHVHPEGTSCSALRSRRCQRTNRIHSGHGYMLIRWSGHTNRVRASKRIHHVK
jgi:hypothetical protein